MIKGKKGIVIGIANDHSIAWGIAKQLHANGAELAITYQNNTLLKRVKPLADKVNSDILVECDVNNEDHLQNTFTQIKKGFGKIDFIIHAVAYSDKNELNGRYVDTSKDNFINYLSEARTYAFFEDIEKMRTSGLAMGGNLNNALVVDKFKVLNPNGLRFEKEFVKHKTLDCVGDFYLLGMQLIGEVECFARQERPS